MSHLIFLNIPHSLSHPTPALPEATNSQSHQALNPVKRTPETISPAEDRSLCQSPELTNYEFEICKDILNRVLDSMSYLEFTQYYALDPNFTIIMDKDQTAALRRALKKF